jgi:cob(I)alamin adenosyltransferase
MKIYTKTGDTGDTGLFGGPRVAKDDPRIEAIGDVDELNATIGLVRTQLGGDSTTADIERLLSDVQHHLFDLGAELATPDPQAHGTALLQAEHATQLEQAVDRWEADLQPLKQFILPGGTPAAAALHIARAVCRRAERRVVTLGRTEKVRGELVIYLNRLSDLLFVLARAANHVAGVGDVAWEGGQRSEVRGRKPETRA